MFFLYDILVTLDGERDLRESLEVLDYAHQDLEVPDQSVGVVAALVDALDIKLLFHDI
jgi:hypothetical protein